MPHIELNGAQIWYKDTGEGDQTIVFAHGLLWSGEMFDDQVEHFKNRYRCVTFDFRGQGKSEVTDKGYDMDSLTLDAVELIRKLDCGPVHFAGLSMGGFVGMRLAIRHPDLLHSLILIETSADPEPSENLFKYNVLKFVGRWFGFGLVASSIMPIMFGKTFMSDPERVSDRDRWRTALINNDRVGTTRAASGTIGREGVFGDLGKIEAPTLIVVGEEDTATVPEKAERMHAAIESSKLVYIEGAGHSSTIEKPEAVNSAVEEFLKEIDQDG
ncbi:MAG: alpha/beta hydrolase [Acidobacteria bacterium]|nr:MAG: alpha/beta hydrolase [Acidobacteriota bacterium]REK02510.1 MAG: alpha/beta hydrolase [Acidobacteriota bacterium]REK13688.1 MAG: alpha/beta hydrolase [Acidobacteriota bacterium]REK41682.1 MAG: alpha/beta hydrolase [Acidobacteriota bacterium]